MINNIKFNNQVLAKKYNVKNCQFILKAAALLGIVDVEGQGVACKIKWRLPGEIEPKHGRDLIEKAKEISNSRESRINRYRKSSSLY